MNWNVFSHVISVNAYYINGSSHSDCSCHMLTVFANGCLVNVSG